MTNQDQEMEIVIQSLIAEGVTNDDMIWWSGLSDEETQDIMKADYAQRMATILHFTKNGLSPKEALVKLGKTLILYANYPLDKKYIEECKQLGIDEIDYPLPWILGKRIGNYVNSLDAEGQLLFKKEIDKFSSVNACIRIKILSGEI